MKNLIIAACAATLLAIGADTADAQRRTAVGPDGGRRPVLVKENEGARPARAERPGARAAGALRDKHSAMRDKARRAGVRPGNGRGIGHNGMGGTLTSPRAKVPQRPAGPRVRGAAAGGHKAGGGVERLRRAGLDERIGERLRGARIERARRGAAAAGARERAATEKSSKAPATRPVRRR
ncbi:hypothetical protein Pla163_16150 [Planctomycetes bacterium Pla163]|uniref:Uncharacterized protein n=1 Tax=Rohdeia mirabilis TaxID=2528008 RepID=A0A518CZ85_9BACT|nr:hypothetical protein Pla163_16150 [Planctomycetes bacterium Pla163]